MQNVSITLPTHTEEEWLWHEVVQVEIINLTAIAKGIWRGRNISGMENVSGNFFNSFSKHSSTVAAKYVRL